MVVLLYILICVSCGGGAETQVADFPTSTPVPAPSTTTLAPTTTATPTTAAPTTTATPTTATPTTTNDYDYRQDDENILNHMFASNEACLIDELSAQVIDELQLRPMTFWEQDSALRCTASPEDGSQQQPGHPEST